MLSPRRHPSTRPFMAAPRPQFYHPAPGIQAALESVERSIRRAEGVALVVGQPGTGKSLLLAKVAEHVRDDFDVAFLSGARICTRRALWQSILAEIGEPYRGIDEGELRMAVVERIRGLAATGAGLVVLVDEAHTLPTRLLEELRLLTNVPTPLPAVHIVLAGSCRLEEMLALPRMASLAQRIAVRAYLEPLDHAETMDYLRGLPRAAGLEWDRLFDRGCDDAVFTATDGVPRLVNQLCDHALVLAADTGRRVTPADIAAAWREIQRLPAPPGVAAAGRHCDDRPGPERWSGSAAADDAESFGDDVGVIEFGGLDDDLGGAGPVSGVEYPGDESTSAAADTPSRGARPVDDLFRGPEVELVFGADADPFEEFFADEERVVERYLMNGPDDFGDRPHVASREGQALARLLAGCEREPVAATTTARAEPRHTVEPRVDRPAADAASMAEITAETDDTDMVVIEEDLAPVEPPPVAGVFAVRPGDYRSLFTRLRRGDR